MEVLRETLHLDNLTGISSALQKFNNLQYKLFSDLFLECVVLVDGIALAKWTKTTEKGSPPLVKSNIGNFIRRLESNWSRVLMS